VPELLSAAFEATANVVTLHAGHCPNWSRPTDAVDLLASVVDSATTAPSGR
jgi:hypothetical protein